MEQKQNESGTKIKNVFIGRNATTGKPYFQRRRVRIVSPEDLPPPTIDELPPLDEDGNPVLQGSLDELLNKKKAR